MSAKHMLVISAMFQIDPKRNSVGFRCRSFPFWTVLKIQGCKHSESEKKLSLMLLFQGFLFCVGKKQVLYLIEGGKKKINMW